MSAVTGYRSRPRPSVSVAATHRLLLAFLLAGCTSVGASDAYGDRSLLDDGPTQTWTGTRTTITSSLRGFSETVRIDQRDIGLTIDRTALTCHGGVVEITWHVGNLEPTVPDTGIYLTARLDGQPVASITKGSTRGIYDDGPVDLRAVVDCPAGSHVVDLLIDRMWADGGWGIPYVVNVGEPSDGIVVMRGFVVTETY